MKTDFNTFSSGDKVLVKADHPYYNSELLEKDRVYEIDKMLSAAGVVTLKGFPYSKTFSDDLFTLVKEAE